MEENNSVIKSQSDSLQHQEKMLALLGDERRKVDAFLNSFSSNLLNESEKENFDIRTMMEHPNSHVRAKGVEVLESQLIGDNQIAVSSGYYKILFMQTKLSSSMIQFAKVSVGDMKKPTEPINKEGGQ